MELCPDLLHGRPAEQLLEKSVYKHSQQKSPFYQFPLEDWFFSLSSRVSEVAQGGQMPLPQAES